MSSSEMARCKHQETAQAYRVIAKQETTNGGGHTQKDSFDAAVGAIDAYIPTASMSGVMSATGRVQGCNSRFAKPHGYDAERAQLSRGLLKLMNNDKEGPKLIYDGRVTPLECPAYHSAHRPDMPSTCVALNVMEASSFQTPASANPLK